MSIITVGYHPDCCEGKGKELAVPIPEEGCEQLGPGADRDMGSGFLNRIIEQSTFPKCGGTSVVWQERSCKVLQSQNENSLMSFDKLVAVLHFSFVLLLVVRIF